MRGGDESWECLEAEENSYSFCRWTCCSCGDTFTWWLADNLAQELDPGPATITHRPDSERTTRLRSYRSGRACQSYQPQSGMDCWPSYNRRRPSRRNDLDSSHISCKTPAGDQSGEDYLRIVPGVQRRATQTCRHPPLAAWIHRCRGLATGQMPARRGWMT